MSDSERQSHRWSLDQEAAAALAEHGIIRELNRSGYPHFAVKVPNLDKALEADLGLEVDREEDGCVVLSVLLYDIPTEPVSYEERFYPDEKSDLQFLRKILEVSAFRLSPCEYSGETWVVGPSQTFRLPPNILLRLKHYSLSWPLAEKALSTEASIPPSASDISEPGDEREAGGIKVRGPDPRETVIRKLKEQVHALRAQVQERDKRIIELEDELHEIRSRGRSYRLGGEKRPWWKPF